MLRLVITALILSASFAQAGEIKVWLGTSVTEGSLKPVIEKFPKDTGVQIVMPGDNKQMNAPGMFKDLVAGKIEAAALASPYSEWLAAAKAAGVDAKQAEAVTSRVIARDEVEFFVNSGNGVSSLTMDELGKLLSGTVKNWKELKGNDAPVEIFAANKPTTIASVKKATLGGKNYSPSLVKVESYKDAVQKVGATSGGISFGPKGTADSSVKVVKTPPVNRPITLISKGKPSDDLQKFIEYVRVHGGGN